MKLITPLIAIVGGFAAAGMAMAIALHLPTRELTIVIAVSLALGMVASAIYAVFDIKKRAKAAGAGGAPGGAPGAAPTDMSEEIDTLIREGDVRLAQSRAGTGIANLPLVFVVGDRGTAKTSTIVNSGTEPELLAGQVYQDNAIVSTRAANMFFARNTAFVEAGGSLMGDPSAWTKLVSRLRPGRLKSLVGGKGQAPRAVLLCFDLEVFTRPGASEAITAAARYLQARLGEISQILGIRFPVYAVFTRGDRLPFFAEFVRNLNSDEAGQVVGATLPIRPLRTTGVYAEEEGGRVSAAFDELFHSFADQRLRLLPRESDATKVPAAYEFPREFRKLRNALVEFLVDVCRPSQLRASPYLRGFYFSGVRPVEVSDIPAPMAENPEATPPGAEFGGATRMFRVGFQAEQRQKQAMAGPTSTGASRKVPQWLFLGHLFNDVILADEAARSASGSSVKTSMLKRLMLASAGALFLLYSLLLVVSYVKNKSLEDNAIVAARNIGVADVPPGNFATVDSLKRLDTLRQSLAQLSAWEHDGAPFGYRWGLYSGSAMLPNVRRIYYDKFRQLLFGNTQKGLLAFLQATPANPGPDDDYGYAYDTTKAYLLTTTEWKRASDSSLQTFLGGKLLERWSANHENDIGKERMDLAKQQFDFYSQDLQYGNPYRPEGDATAVARGQLYLSKFSGIQRVYRFLLSQAAKKGQPVSFNQKFPGTAEVLTSTEPVVWAFTKDGWAFIQDQIKKQNFGGEEWVLGPYHGQALDKASMEQGILALYGPDYVSQWRNVLKKSNVNRYASWADASKKLTILTGSGAPLLALMWWTSSNTAIEAPGVSEKFKAPQMVVPPSTVQQYIVGPNQNYNNALLSLQQAVDKAANKDPDGERAAHDSGQSATLVTRQLTATFPPDPEAHIDARTEELLLQPIRYLDGLAGGDLKSGAASFCSSFDILSKKFPFNPTAQPEVTLEELANLIKPPTGKLWTLYNSSLKSVMTCQNGECTASSPMVGPGYVHFISNMMKFSRAIYGDAGGDPNLHYSLKPTVSDQVSEFDISVNGTSATLKGGASHAFVFPGSGTPSFHITLKLATGTPLEAETWDDLWSVFRFFADADSMKTPSTFDFLVRSGRAGKAMQVNGKNLTYEISVDMSGPAVFSKEFLSTLKCGAPVSR